MSLVYYHADNLAVCHQLSAIMAAFVWVPQTYLCTDMLTVTPHVRHTEMLFIFFLRIH